MRPIRVGKFIVRSCQSNTGELFRVWNGKTIVQETDRLLTAVSVARALNEITESLKGHNND